MARSFTDEGQGPPCEAVAMGAIVTARQRELAELRDRYDRYLRYTAIEPMLVRPPGNADIWSNWHWTVDVESEFVNPSVAEFTARRAADQPRETLDAFVDWVITSEVSKELMYVSGDNGRDAAGLGLGDPPEQPNLRATENHRMPVYEAVMLIHYADHLRERQAAAKSGGDAVEQ